MNENDENEYNLELLYQLLHKEFRYFYIEDEDKQSKIQINN